MSKLSMIPLYFAVVMAVGAPVTLAAVGSPNSGAETIAVEKIRPLTIRHTVTAQPAFGEDDEDCVLQTRRGMGPDGRVVITRKLVCADADVD